MSAPTSPATYTPYTDAEKAYLRAHYATATRAEIEAVITNRPWQSIRCKAFKMGVTGRPLTTPITQRTSWHTANMAIIRELYPQPGGTALVVAATGFTVLAVRACAMRNGIKCGPRIMPPRVVLPKAARPVGVAKPAAPRRVQVRPSTSKTGVAPQCATPIANASRAKRQAAAAVKPPITAEQVRKMSYNDPQRVAYTLGGVAGWTQYMNAQA